MKATIKKYRIITIEQTCWLLLLCFAVITIMVACDQRKEKEESNGSESTTSTISTTSTESEPPKPQEQETIFDRSVLVDDWVRTDADYRIRISELLDDGTLKASYFNPEEINVDKAGWIFADGAMKIYIELRDENYPGSNYNLVYYPDKDLLIGKYFQAVEGVTYDVGFFRKK